jgi:hypothetical protein
MCARSKYNDFAIGWNFLSVANGDSHTDMECLNAILTVQRFRYESAIQKPPERLPAVSQACIHPEPKTATKVEKKARAKACS